MAPPANEDEGALHGKESAKDGKTPPPKSATKVATVTGAKMKMPSGQLQKFTKAYKKLVQLHSAREADGPLQDAVAELERELSTLVKDLDSLRPVGDAQVKQKQEWVAKNMPDANSWLQQVKEAIAASQTTLMLPLPAININGAPANLDDLTMESRSHVSNLSASSSVRRAAAEARAEREALILEREHLEWCHQQELEERQRQRQFEEEQLQRRLRREHEEVQFKIKQAQLRENALQKALAEGSLHSKADDALSCLPSIAQPTTNWLEAAQVGPPAPPTLPPLPRDGPAIRQPLGPAPPVRSPQPAHLDTRPGPLPGFDQALVQHLLLAQARLPVFRGDPLEFLWFRQALEEQVELVTPDPRRRLHLLLQQLEGEPHTLVKGCQLIDDPQLGYDRAKAKLVEQYGHPVRQSYTFKTKLMSWPHLRKDSAKDLHSFSVQLQHCEDVKVVGALHDLDAPGVIAQLMAKLPEKQQQAWRLKACDIEQAQLRSVGFSDFVAFVKRLAAAHNHPVFGASPVSSTVPEERGDRRANREARAFTTDATDNQDQLNQPSSLGLVPEASALASNTDVNLNGRPDPPNAFRGPCLVCEGPHSASRCAHSALPRAEKLERLRGLCFGCLKPGHQARNCKHRLKCDICQALHPTPLHENIASTAPPAQEGPPAHVEVVRATHNSELSPNVAIATVAVEVSAGGGPSVIVRAILDSASSATFLTDELARQLGLKGAPGTNTNLKLSTMTDTVEIVTSVVPNMSVANLQTGARVMLPPAYTVASLPFHQSEIPSQEDVQHWEHLRDVPISWVQADVSLLIGANVPDAGQPKELVTGGPGAPYAYKTVLGWCVTGPMRPLARRAPHENIRFVKTDVVQQLSAMYYSEFEGAYDFASRGQSQEDQEWLRRA